MIMHKPKIDLYPHNQETYEKIIEMWKTSNKVAVIQATGTGKTYLMLRCMFDFEPSKKVVLAPSNYILDQLLSKANGNLPNTELMTYAKLANMTKEEIKLLNPSLIVLDEFHRCGADKWELGVDMLIKMFPDAKILGTSATPIRYLDNARDMSDELFDGNIAVNLSLSDAIVKGILPMPKYISALYTFDEEINNLQAKIEKSKNDEETKKEYLKEVEALKNKLNKSKGIPEILKKHISDDGGKFIVFCKDKQHLNEMESTVIEWFKKAKIGKFVEKYRVVSDEIENNKEMTAFRENKNSENARLLFSIDMLNEGIHIDDVNGVILLRPTISPIIFYQQIGRAIQAGNANSPLIFDFVNNFNNLRIKSFTYDLIESARKYNKNKNVNDIINISEFTVIDETKDAWEMFSLIEIDDLYTWDYMFNLLEENKNNKIEINSKLYRWVSNQRTFYKNGLLPNDKIERLNSVQFSWDLYYDKWYEKLKEIQEEINKGTDILKNKSIVSWIHRNRKLYRKGTLRPEKKQKLESIGVNLDVKKNSWETNYQGLIDYKKLNGNCLVPYNYEIGILKLGIWVGSQRTQFFENKLRANKIEKLKKIGFVFNSREDSWYKHFNELKKYKQDNGDCRVPPNFVVHDLSLSNWVVRQRFEFSKGELSKERIDLLNGLEFPWVVGRGK